ncbi:MAG TPA: acetyl-CoA carboxylase biotin carboxyl carrier protein subunit [Gemmatimonadaceae bacterium]|nr:acetyl-CoA carboxylase biotin carboxyl carrier protein subunit [Gemmatimonadaceae bacterium]
MKYIVDVRGRRFTVDLAPGSAAVDGAVHDASLRAVEGTPVRLVTVGSEVHRVVVRRRTARGTYVLWIDGFTYETEALDERTRTIRDLTAKAAGPAGPAPLIAPMPGLIVRVNVKPGDQVKAGQGLVVMEAMKMENELKAHGEGTVKALKVAPGDKVEKGAVLVEMI